MVLVLWAVGGALLAPARAGAEDLELAHGREAAIEHGIQATVAIECRLGRQGTFGTGVLISNDGHILTDITVVPEGAEDIKIWLKGEDTPYDARVVESDPTVEGVVLKIDSKRHDFPFVKLLDTAKLPIGFHLVTLGNPLQSLKDDDQVAVSDGIVSGVYKLRNASTQSHYDGVVLETDAAVNPGSDGGAIIDEDGRLAGIITLGYEKERLQGCGIPTDVLYKALKSLRDVVKTYDDGKLYAPVAPSDPIEEALAVGAQKVAADVVRMDVDREPDRLPDPPLDLPPSMIDLYQQELKQFELTLRPRAPITALMISPDEALTSAALVTANVPNAGKLHSIHFTDPSGKVHDVTLVASHGLMDVALLKIDGYKATQFATLDPTAVPELGSAVGVIGRMRGDDGYTLTKGMVSAVGRGLGFNQVRAYQTDAKINYGNAGGPVVDIHGNIVGLAGNIRLGSQWGQSAGVGLFVGTKDILDALPDLRAGKTVVMPSRTFLGVENDPAIQVEGAAVLKVLPDSAAAAAGVKNGDVIVEADNRPIEEWEDLLKIVTKKRPGDRLLLVVKRGGKEVELTAYLRSHQDQVADANIPDDQPPPDAPAPHGLPAPHKDVHRPKIDRAGQDDGLDVPDAPSAPALTTKPTAPAPSTLPAPAPTPAVPAPQTTPAQPVPPAPPAQPENK